MPSPSPQSLPIPDEEVVNELPMQDDPRIFPDDNPSRVIIPDECIENELTLDLRAMIKESVWQSLATHHRQEELKRVAYLTLRMLGYTHQACHIEVQKLVDDEQARFYDYRDHLKWTISEGEMKAKENEKNAEKGNENNENENTRNKRASPFNSSASQINFMEQDGVGE